MQPNSDTTNPPPKALPPDLRALLPALRLFTEWMILHPEHWSPPPNHRDPTLRPHLDDWRLVAELCSRASEWMNGGEAAAGARAPTVEEITPTTALVVQLQSRKLDNGEGDIEDDSLEDSTNREALPSSVKFATLFEETVFAGFKPMLDLTPKVGIHTRGGVLVAPVVYSESSSLSRCTSTRVIGTLKAWLISYASRRLLCSGTSCVASSHPFCPTIPNAVSTRLWWRGRRVSDESINNTGDHTSSAIPRTLNLQKSRHSNLMLVCLYCVRWADDTDQAGMWTLHHVRHQPGTHAFYHWMGSGFYLKSQKNHDVPEVKNILSQTW